MAEKIISQFYSFDNSKLTNSILSLDMSSVERTFEFPLDHLSHVGLFCFRAQGFQIGVDAGL